VWTPAKCGTPDSVRLREGSPGDVYGSSPVISLRTHIGEEVLGHLHDLPEIILELDQDVCIGEIATDHSNSKQSLNLRHLCTSLQLVSDRGAGDTAVHGAARSEFFAIRHNFLTKYCATEDAYEQTVVILLHAVFGGKGISVSSLETSPTARGKGTLGSAMQQVNAASGCLSRSARTQSNSVRLA